MPRHYMYSIFIVMFTLHVTAILSEYIGRLGGGGGWAMHAMCIDNYFLCAFVRKGLYYDNNDA